MDIGDCRANGRGYDQADAGYIQESLYSRVFPREITQAALDVFHL